MSDKRDPLEAFFSELRGTFMRGPDDETRASHLSAISQAAVASQLSPSAGRVGSRSRGRFARGAVVAAGFVLVGGSALAATGTLPEPVQNVVANAVDDVVDLPGGDKENGQPKNPIAAQNKAEAEAFTTAKKAYNECKKDLREAKKSPDTTEGEEGETETELTDEEVLAACGEKPNPHDYKTDAPKPSKTPKAERTEKPPGHAERTEKPVAERTEKPAPPGQADKSSAPAKTPNPASGGVPKGPPAAGD